MNNNKYENIKATTPSIFYPYLLKQRYKIITGNKLNLFFPQKLSEKIQYLKLFDSTKKKGQWADKVESRKLFIKEIPDGEEYLKPVYGVWDNFEEINFDTLPDMFILKLNHGCGFNTFVMNKNNLLNNKDQLAQLKERINYFKSTRYYLNSLELHYKYIKPKIFAEEIIGGKNSVLYTDWMIYCFNGNTLFCNYILHYKDGYNYSFVYDENYIKQDFSIGFPTLDDANIKKPYNFEKMFEFAKILSRKFKFVRVDFIENDNKLYFAEMTFTPFSGYFNFNGYGYQDSESLKTDFKLGKILKL